MMHGIVVIVFGILTAMACAVGTRWRGSLSLARAERITGIFMLVIWAIANTYWLLPRNFKIDEALPLHMCDLTGLIAPLVLLTGRRPLRSLLYFWGLGLSIHGMATPVLTDGPATLRFWLFWLTHASIIGTAIYDLIAHRYRPAWRDCVFAIGACAVWLVVILVVNLSLNTNYGYVGNTTPDRPTVIDNLGPWPGRVFKMTVAVIALFITMWVPWAIAGRRSRVVRQSN